MLGQKEIQNVSYYKVSKVLKDQTRGFMRATLFITSIDMTQIKYIFTKTI